jgi:Flp pilus assembly protein TadD
MVPTSLKSEGPVFLDLPLLTPRDLKAFRVYVEKTPLGAYLEPGYYDEAGRKLLEVSARQARSSGKKVLETPLGSVFSALKEKTAKNREGKAGIEDFIKDESHFSADETGLLRELYLGNGELARWKDLLAMRPKSPAYFYLYAVAAANSGAQEAWTKALIRQDPEAFLSAAAFYVARDGRKTSVLLDYVLKTPGVPAETLRKGGLVFQNLGRFKEALALLDAAIAGKPRDAALYNCRGLFFRSRGDSARAERDYLKALELDPGFLEAELDLAAVYLAQGKTADAAGNLYNFTAKSPSEGALAAVREKPGLVLAAAGYFSAAGRPQKAGALLDFVLKDPALSLEQLRMASAAYQDLGRYKEALAVTDRALAGHPGESELFNDRGVLLRFSGKPGPAEQDFVKALELKPGAWEPGLNLASLLAGAGRPGEAEKIYERLLGRSDIPARVRTLIGSELAGARAANHDVMRK